MASDHDGVIREFICHHFKVYSPGFYAPFLHLYYGSLLGKISSFAEGELFPGVVHLALPQRNQYRVCL